MKTSPRTLSARRRAPVRHRVVSRIRSAGTALLVVALTAAGTLAGSPAAFADDYPTWDDVKAAQASESAKNDEIAAIQKVISDQQAKVQAAQELVMERTAESDAAQAALTAGQAKADALKTQSAAASAKAEESKKRAAVVAAQFARSGGPDLTSMLITSNSAQADTLLAQLSSAGQLAQAVNGIYASASQDSNTAKTLSEQADVAQQALSGLAAAAQAALEQAAQAQAAMVAQLQEQNAHRDELNAQLTTLQQNTATTKAQYDAGVAARAAAAAAEAAARAAAAAAAREAGGGASYSVVGAVSGDAQALAQELMGYVANGQFHGSTPDHIFEIAWIAQGQDVANCGIDVTILQAMVAAVRAFGSAGVSDISRRCTGQIEGAGTASAHYMQGGGHAVDFTSVGGVPTTGANQASLDLISVLDPMMPNGSRVGQSQCRAAAGNEPSFINFIDFYDTCNHLHVDDF
ncbi:hypothetical protein VD659_00280 [Herbiconiux sp. 11R-BC]|uniref:hypothetical protein n=1 Tax=Herbiconiux sp. 11R-BC TaxID=3111637 RepID=UPI003BFFD6C0